VPSADALARDFDKVEPAISAAAVPASHDGGVLGRLQANAERLVRVRPVGDAPGDDPAAALARAGAKAHRGDIAGALLEVERLPPGDVRPGRVARDSEDGDPCSLEVRAPVTQELHLVRSGRGPVEEVEEEQERPAVAELGDRGRLAGREPDRRLGNMVACGEHRRSLLGCAAPAADVREPAAELPPDVRHGAGLLRPARAQEEELVRVGPGDEEPRPVRRPAQAGEVSGAGGEPVRAAVPVLLMKRMIANQVLVFLSK